MQLEAPDTRTSVRSATNAPNSFAFRAVGAGFGEQLVSLKSYAAFWRFARYDGFPRSEDRHAK
jgi:hypothetical protein